MTVHVRYFAAAAAAAGRDDEAVEAGTLGAILDAMTARHGAPLAKVLPACSFLIDGRSTTDRDTQVDDGSGLDVLPPFAGG